MIAAIVLAAGESRRMGSPKALLPFSEPDGSETTFLSHLVGVFDASQASPIVVVLGHQADDLAPRFDLSGVEVVVNEDYQSGMLSSIQAGVASLSSESVEGALVCPVDHPDVQTAVVDILIERFGETRPPIVLPVHGGRRGHPVLFARSVFEEIARAPAEVGARRVVWDHQKDLLEVKVSDAGVTVDIDTPDDYRAFRGDEE